MMRVRKLIGRAVLWFIEPVRAERAEEFLRRSRHTEPDRREGTHAYEAGRGQVYLPARYGKPKGW